MIGWKVNQRKSGLSSRQKFSFLHKRGFPDRLAQDPNKLDDIASGEINGKHFFLLSLIPFPVSFPDNSFHKKLETEMESQIFPQLTKWSFNYTFKKKYNFNLDSVHKS